MGQSTVVNMHRNQFDNKYTAFRIDVAEMERKWALYLREQEEMELLRRASRGIVSVPYEDLKGLYMDNDYMEDEKNYVL
jgi:hypothetical protein